MQKGDLARRLANQTGESRGEAADRLDAMLRDLIRALRRRGYAMVPGMGRFTIDRKGEIHFERP